MNLFNPDTLQNLAFRYGLDPSKKYGQNYLVDENVIENIKEKAALTKNDTVVEVGPGFGVLSFPLSESVKELVCFEIEKKLESYWTEKKRENMTIVWGNVLYKFSETHLGDYKVVSNLPYQITSAVIRLFLEAENHPKEMILMVQREVAERVVAKPGDMSLLSLSVQYYAEPKIEFLVPRSAFWPSPRVDSAVISVKNIQKKDRGESVEVFKLAKIGFANRRKMLIKNLEPVVGKGNKQVLQQVFSEMGLSEKSRAQELSVEQWVELTNRLQKLSKGVG